eukprot:gene18563-28646_t
MESFWLCDDCLFATAYEDYSMLSLYYTTDEIAKRIADLHLGLRVIGHCPWLYIHLGDTTPLGCVPPDCSLRRYLMNTQLTLIETSDVEADRIAQENQLIDEALHILDRRLFTRGPA